MLCPASAWKIYRARKILTWEDFSFVLWMATWRINLLSNWSMRDVPIMFLTAAAEPYDVRPMSTSLAWRTNIGYPISSMLVKPFKFYIFIFERHFHHYHLVPNITALPNRTTPQPFSLLCYHCLHDNQARAVTQLDIYVYWPTSSCIQSHTFLKSV